MLTLITKIVYTLAAIAKLKLINFLRRFFIEKDFVICYFVIYFL